MVRALSYTTIVGVVGACLVGACAQRAMTLFCLVHAALVRQYMLDEQLIVEKKHTEPWTFQKGLRMRVYVVCVYVCMCVCGVCVCVYVVYVCMCA